MTSLNCLFWSSWFWLPNSTSWQEFAELKQPSEYKPRLQDLWIMFPCTVAIHIVRLATERFLLKPIGRHYGLREFVSPKSAPGQASKLQKFAEASWHGCFYIMSSIYGVAALWDKAYLWDTRLLWRDWPHHAVPTEIYWYYMLELCYYWAALFYISFESKKKDFFEMVLHHVVTIWLLVFSWSANFVRVGSLVLLVHDVVDPFLQGAKVFKYLGMQSLCNLSFTLFTLGWLLTRLSAYPLVILRSSLWQSVEELGMFPAHLLFNGALILLQCLHIVWFYFIVKILIRSLRVGKVVNDTRSDSEQSDCSDDESHSPVANGAQAVRRRHRNGLAKNSST